MILIEENFIEDEMLIEVRREYYARGGGVGKNVKRVYNGNKYYYFFFFGVKKTKSKIKILLKFLFHIVEKENSK